jgi:hypothetical protein
MTLNDTVEEMNVTVRPLVAQTWIVDFLENDLAYFDLHFNCL